MKKVLKVLFIVFCTVSLFIVIAPFHNVYANNIYVENFGTSNILGVTAIYTNDAFPM